MATLVGAEEPLLPPVQAAPPVVLPQLHVILLSDRASSVNKAVEASGPLLVTTMV